MVRWAELLGEVLTCMVEVLVLEAVGAAAVDAAVAVVDAAAAAAVDDAAVVMGMGMGGGCLSAADCRGVV